MARRNPTPPNDPAEVINRQVLADREQRVQARHRTEERPVLDLGLGLQEKESQADSAVEYLRDTFDKQNFGDPVPTIRKIAYGPDPLLTSCPELKARIEQIGLIEYANVTAETILRKEENAFADPILKRAMAGAIRKFGAPAVAEAFKARILRIPQREYEVEVDRGIDEMLGRPLEEAVARYGTPGMSPKFLSQRCIDVLGLRGYRIVKDEHGDPVRVGTLIMGEIPIEMAEARRRHWAEQSEAEVKAQQDAYMDEQERLLRTAAQLGISLGATRPLRTDEAVTANATEQESYLGDTRSTGIRIERHT